MQSVNKILIQGYYGFENIGDDILMMITYNLITEKYPDAEISVFSNAKNNAYIEELVGKKLDYLNSETFGNFDLVVHGGGGVFFDFSHGSSKQKLVNRTIKIIGKNNYSALYPKLRRWAGKPSRITTRSRIGIGLGIGTFTNSSAKFWTAIPLLHSFNHMIVRDQESILNLKSLQYKGSVEQSTDMAFMKSHWMPTVSRKEKKSKSIAVILKDWHFNDHSHIRIFQDRLTAIEKAGFAITFYSFCPPKDQFFIELFKSDYTVHEWNPHDSDLQSYLGELSKHQAVVTSRAHGCIIGACLGIPPICIDIEPKLRMFASMLPMGAAIIAEDAPAETWIKLLQKTCDNAAAIEKSLEEEIEVNRLMIEQSIARTMQKLDELHG
jgi:polysaccharide pyruvyl transferase WcaK-like protein